MKKPELDKFAVLKHIRGMIIGNDLDALLSACLLKSRFDLDISGIYDNESSWFDDELSEKDFLSNLTNKKYMAVDLDIYRNYLPSIGHHILAIHPNDILPQHENTLNPNLLRGITHEKFKQKFPLGTVHFLMWLLNEYQQITRVGELLLWLADSTFINAQKHRFQNNVKNWLKNHVQNRILLQDFEEVNSELFEKEIKNIAIPQLEKTGLARGKGQVKSFHLKIQGYQCQWSNPNKNRKNIISLLDIIEKNTGWQKPQLPNKFESIRGQRRSYKFSKEEAVESGFLRKFLAERKVFSYVISNRFLINYTTGIDFK